MSTPMTDRFQKSRWTPMRVKIHAMKPGDSMEFTREEHGRARSICQSLTDACGDRKWSIKRNKKGSVVKCEKNEISAATGRERNAHE